MADELNIGFSHDGASTLTGATAPNSTGAEVTSVKEIIISDKDLKSNVETDISEVSTIVEKTQRSDDLQHGRRQFKAEDDTTVVECSDNVLATENHEVAIESETSKDASKHNLSIEQHDGEIQNGSSTEANELASAESVPTEGADHPATTAGSGSTSAGSKLKQLFTFKKAKIKPSSLNKAFLSIASQSGSTSFKSGVSSSSIEKGISNSSQSPVPMSNKLRLNTKMSLVRPYQLNNVVAGNEITPAASSIKAPAASKENIGNIGVWGKSAPSGNASTLNSKSQQTADERTKKSGIHITERLKGNDSRNGRWEDIQDDEEAVPNAIEFADGTRFDLDKVKQNASKRNEHGSRKSLKSPSRQSANGKPGATEHPEFSWGVFGKGARDRTKNADKSKDQQDQNDTGLAQRSRADSKASNSSKGALKVQVDETSEIRNEDAKSEAQEKDDSVDGLKQLSAEEIRAQQHAYMTQAAHAAIERRRRDEEERQAAQLRARKKAEELARVIKEKEIGKLRAAAASASEKGREQNAPPLSSKSKGRASRRPSNAGATDNATNADQKAVKSIYSGRQVVSERNIDGFDKAQQERFDHTQEMLMRTTGTAEQNTAVTWTAARGKQPPSSRQPQPSQSPSPQIYPQLYGDSAPVDATAAANMNQQRPSLAKAWPTNIVEIDKTSQIQMARQPTSRSTSRFFPAGYVQSNARESGDKSPSVSVTNVSHQYSAAPPVMVSLSATGLKPTMNGVGRYSGEQSADTSRSVGSGKSLAGGQQNVKQSSVAGVAQSAQGFAHPKGTLSSEPLQPCSKLNIFGRNENITSIRIQFPSENALGAKTFEAGKPQAMSTHSKSSVPQKQGMFSGARTGTGKIVIKLPAESGVKRESTSDRLPRRGRRGSNYSGKSESSVHRHRGGRRRVNGGNSQNQHQPRIQTAVAATTST